MWYTNGFLRLYFSDEPPIYPEKFQGTIASCDKIQGKILWKREHGIEKNRSDNPEL